MENTLKSIKNNAVSLILESKTRQELEDVRIQFLGRNGQLTVAMKEVAKLPMEERPAMGRLANETKSIIEDAINRAEAQLSKRGTVERTRMLDVTEPGIRPPLGHLHLISQAIAEITTIFEKIGFTRVRYPEIECDWYAFE